jgi:glycosyltransferase involved in cell wall biosynthesis
VSLTIFILCYNRPDLAKYSIESVIAQTCQKFNLVISDHSTNHDVKDMVAKNFPGITYKRRSSALKHLEHFNLCINEVEDDYYCLFHDDDIMATNFVEEMLHFIEAHPDAAAFACNAYIENRGQIEKRLSFLSHKQSEVFHSPKQLAQRYFSRNQSGIAPNPSYIYNRKIAGKQGFIVDGGKYADVSMLLDVSQKGQILWLNKPLMTYRFHGNNLGSFESRPDRIRFLAYLKKHQNILGHEVLHDYRSSFIYKRVLSERPATYSKRYTTAKSYLKSYHCYHYTRLSTYLYLVKRVLNKWGGA